MKISFEILNSQIEKIYNQEIDINNTDAVNAQAEYICDFVQACGWSWDDYLNRWLFDSTLN